MGSDNVNSINDTEESQDVAHIVKEVYFDIVGHHAMAEHEGLFQLNPSGDNTKPCYMTLPSNALSMAWLKYNESTDGAEPVYRDLELVSFPEFQRRTQNLDDTGTDVSVQSVLNADADTYRLKYHNDRMPSFYSIVGDYELVFNAYDSTEENTLTKSRTQAWGLLMPSFSLTDGHTPDLDARQFQLLLSTAKAQAAIEIDQQENPAAERKSRRNWILAQKTKDSTNSWTALERHQNRRNFGRK
jgi:competence protein ComGC